MGFSVSGSTALLLVAALIAFGGFQTAVSTGAERVTDARDASSERLLEQRNTRVALTNATYNATAGRLTVRVENTGTTSLAVEGVDLLVDGSYRSANRSVVGAADTARWHPGETLVLNASATDPTRVKVVTGPGVAVRGVV